MQGTSSAECIHYVNNVLARQGDGTMFVTLFYGILDTRNGQLDYCNAGHHPALCLLRRHRDSGKRLKAAA